MWGGTSTRLSGASAQLSTRKGSSLSAVAACECAACQPPPVQNSAKKNEFAMVVKAAEAVEVALRDGVQHAMERFNG